MILAALRSRHQSEVATWGQAAWACRDECTPSMRATCAGCARDMCATSLLCAQQRPRHGHCARSVRARPGFWVCAPCTQPSFVTVHCLGSLFGHCSWTLFKNTVHRVKKKKYKIFKNFIGGDLIHEIFILHLL